MSGIIKITDTISGIMERLHATLPESWDLAMEQFSIDAAVYCQTFILDAIAKGHPIGHFMAPRTKVSVAWVGRSIDHKILLLTVQGIPEGQVGRGSNDTAGPNDNLWNVQEHGMTYAETRYPTAGRAMLIRFGDGPKFTASAGPIEIKKYVGKVSSIIEQIRPQLYIMLEHLASDIATRLTEDITAKTGIKFGGTGVIDWMKAHNLNTLMLQNLGISSLDSKTKINGSGLMIEQVFVRDKGGRFMSLGMDINYKLVYR